MKKALLFISLLAVTSLLQAQNSEKELAQNTEKAVKTLADTATIGWKTKGNFSLLFNQSNFSNWVAGGENNLSGNVSINYDFNYKKKE